MKLNAREDVAQKDDQAIAKDKVTKRQEFKVQRKNVEKEQEGQDLPC